MGTRKSVGKAILAWTPAVIRRWVFMAGASPGILSPGTSRSLRGGDMIVVLRPNRTTWSSPGDRDTR